MTEPQERFLEAYEKSGCWFHYAHVTAGLSAETVIRWSDTCLEFRNGMERIQNENSNRSRNWIMEIAKNNGD